VTPSNKLPGKRYPRVRLRELYAEAGKWSNVADLLKDELKQDPTRDLEYTKAAYWQLIEIYRDHLRQPGLVVTTLARSRRCSRTRNDTEALLKVVETQQAQFDAMKRWPDLIGRIRRRAELTVDPAGRTALHLEAGRLFLDKFNNQAEAIKSFESVLEADEFNAEAITKLKDLYAKRRDWEKMVHVQQKELTLLADPAQRMEQLLDIARTAVAKIKKNPLSIELWNQVLASDADQPRGPRAARGSARAREGVGAARQASSARSPRSRRTTPSASSTSSSSARCTATSSTTTRPPSTPGSSSTASSPRTVALRTRSRSSTWSSATWRACRSSTPSRTSGASSSACSRRSPRPPRAASARRCC
jgi:tetratricopeptide (TPR) repeat protein